MMKTLLLALALVALCVTAHCQTIQPVISRTNGTILAPTNFFAPGTNIHAGEGIALYRTNNGLGIRATGLTDTTSTINTVSNILLTGYVSATNDLSAVLRSRMDAATNALAGVVAANITTTSNGLTTASTAALNTSSNSLKTELVAATNTIAGYVRDRSTNAFSVRAGDNVTLTTNYTGGGVVVEIESTGGSGGGGVGAINESQFGTNSAGLLSAKDGFAVTNANLYGPVVQNATAAGVAIYDANKRLTNANPSVTPALLTNLVGVTGPLQTQIGLLTPLTTYSGGTNQIYNEIFGPFVPATDPANIDMSIPRQDITITTGPWNPTYSVTNNGRKTLILLRVPTTQTINFTNSRIIKWIGDNSPPASFSGTNWFGFACVSNEIFGSFEAFPGTASTNFAVSVASNFVHVAAGLGVTVTTNVSDGKRIFTIATGAGSGDVTYAQQITTSNIIWQAKVDQTNGTSRGLTVASNIVWTVRNQTAASQSTNFVVDFSPQNAGAVQLTGANITNVINIAHSTNWPSGGEATVKWTIFTTITNRHLFIPSAFQAGVYGTNSATQFLLPSNKVVTVSFTSLTGANSGVIFNMPIWNDQAFGGSSGSGEVSTAQLNTASNVVWAAKANNSSGLSTNLTVRGLTVASNIVYTVATGAAVANLTNWVVDFSPNAASEVDIYSNAITNKIHILHTTNWPSGARGFVAWNIYTGITNRHLGLATALQKVIGTNYGTTVSDILLPSNTMARVTFMSTTNSNAGARMTYPIFTAWP